LDVPRRVRKVTLYVCTSDGSIHITRAAAKTRSIELDARAPKRGARKRGASWVGAVLRAIDGGAKDARTIRDKTDVPPRLVHPTLSNLRKRGLVKGSAGSLALTREGKKHLEGIVASG
jgi:predicted methyltransferase